MAKETLIVIESFEHLLAVARAFGIRPYIDDDGEVCITGGARDGPIGEIAEALNYRFDDHEAEAKAYCCQKGGEAPEPKDHVSIQRFFTYLHLPVHLQEISKPFCDLARSLTELLPDNEERSVALRKLLESKDAAVRARLAE